MVVQSPEGIGVGETRRKSAPTRDGSEVAPSSIRAFCDDALARSFYGYCSQGELRVNEAGARGPVLVGDRFLSIVDLDVS